MKYVVRTGFVVHLKDEDGSSHTYTEGKVINLTPEQVELHAHQIELAPEKGKEKAAA
jgi:hypothetical protein